MSFSFELYLQPWDYIQNLEGFPQKDNLGNLKNTLQCYIEVYIVIHYCIWPKLCRHLIITPVCAHSKTMVINMELVPSLLL